MAEEIQEVVQIIRIVYDGIEIAIKIGSGTIGQIKKALDFMVALLAREKVMGKEGIRKLLMKGGDLQVLQFATEDMKKVEKLSKKYGLLYSVLPDINKRDGMSEIIFHTEAVPRVNMMLQKLKTGRIATFDDYLKNGDEKEMDKILSFLKGKKTGEKFPGGFCSLRAEETEAVNEKVEGLIEKVGLYAAGKQDINVEDVKEKFGIGSIQAENVLEMLGKIGLLEKGGEGKHRTVMDKNAFLDRFHSCQELAERMQAIPAAQDGNILDVTVAKELIAEENDRAVKARIPGTWGENAKFLWINRQKIMEIHSGKTMLTFLDMDKEYKLYSADNRVIGTMKGDKLYEEHYDRVGAEVRRRYAAAGWKAEALEKKMPVQKGR